VMASMDDCDANDMQDDDARGVSAPGHDTSA
jgi:hypothetical protein